jgi:hypothetical protein
MTHYDSIASYQHATRGVRLGRQQTICASAHKAVLVSPSFEVSWCTPSLDLPSPPPPNVMEPLALAFHTRASCHCGTVVMQVPVAFDPGSTCRQPCVDFHVASSRILH